MKNNNIYEKQYRYQYIYVKDKSQVKYTLYK